MADKKSSFDLGWHETRDAKQRLEEISHHFLSNYGIEQRASGRPESQATCAVPEQTETVLPGAVEGVINNGTEKYTGGGMSLVISRKGNPSQGELRDLIVTALDSMYPGATLLDAAFPLLPEVMLVMESGGVLRVVGYDAQESGHALLRALQGAEKIAENSALLPRLYPPLAGMQGERGVEIAVVAPQGLPGIGHCLKADSFTCTVLEIEGRAAILVEPTASGSRPADTAHAGPDAGRTPQPDAPAGVTTAEPAGTTVAPGAGHPAETDSILTEEEENFFRQI